MDLVIGDGADGTRWRLPRHQAFLNDRSSLRARWASQAVPIQRAPGRRSSGRTGLPNVEAAIPIRNENAIDRLRLDEISPVVSTSRPAGSGHLGWSAVAEGAVAGCVERVLRAP